MSAPAPAEVPLDAPQPLVARPGGVRALLEAMRPKQWLKNGFVLAGVIFAGRLFDKVALLRAAAAFVIFCGAASATYLINDVLDRANDAHHPEKRHRAIASGRLSANAALLAALLVGGASLFSAAVLSRALLAFLLGYLLLTASYSLVLKRVFIVDAIAVSAGFVLRAAAGAAVVPAEISPWLLSCTFLLALFISFGRRRHEMVLLGDTAEVHRTALTHYTVPLLDSWLTALSGATIVTFALYTQAPRTVQHFGTTNLIFTVPFVVYALFRYQWLIVRGGRGGDPSSALFDRGLILSILGWGACAAWVIYAR
jgi:4-hydroxybenzoate polyprenyltransferase